MRKSIFSVLRGSRKTKLWMAFLLMMLILMSNVSCSGKGMQDAIETPAYNDSGTKTIYVNTSARGTEVTKAILAGIISGAEEENCEIIFQADINGNIDTNIMYIGQALEQGVDGMILTAVHEEKYIDIINQVVETGIPVVTVHSDAPDSRRKAYCGPNYDEYAKNAAYWMADAIGYKGNVGVMIGNISGTHEPKIADIFVATIEENFPDIHVVAIDGDTIDPARASEKVEKIVGENPDLAGVFNTTAATVEQWNDMIIKNNLDMKVIVMDTLPEQLEYLLDGTIYGIISQGLFEEGYLSAKALFDAEPEEYQYVESVFVTGSDLQLIQQYQEENEKVEEIIQRFKNGNE